MRSTGAARADSPAGPAPPRGPRGTPASADLGAGAEEVDLAVLLAADLLDDVQSSYFVESSRLINEALAAARELLVIANALPEPRTPERRRFS
jgi:hypothetical protein